MQSAQASLLPDGKRLHLHHGPIDLIVETSAPGRPSAYHRATSCFATILEELVCELPLLRQPVGIRPKGHVARRMHAATLPFATDFITPMAAVAGAVADEILASITTDPAIRKAYVNNGGDTAFHLTGGQTMTIGAPPAAQITLTASDPWRGIATSGWRGRSHSLGIADSVTVLAATAAQADAASTMIANAIDLPGDPRIMRAPANTLAPDSDLGPRLVTTQVPPLDPASRARALDVGQKRATDYIGRHLIGAAYLTLQGDFRVVGPLPLLQPETLNA